MKKFYITSKNLIKKGIACLIEAESPEDAYAQWIKKFSAKISINLFTEEDWQQMVNLTNRWHLGEMKVCDFKVVSIDEITAI